MIWRQFTGGAGGGGGGGPANPSRRAFSKAFLGGGSAAAIGLPFLESLVVPREARAAAAVPAAKRLLFLFIPNGIQQANYRPATVGSDYAITPILKPLEALRGDISVVSGLENAPARPDPPGDHASGTSAFITCAKALKSETSISLGISADQVAAAQIGSLTRLPSLQLGIEGGSSAGGCDSGYGCAYTRNISWSGPSTPLPKITNPQLVFDRLFAGFDPNASVAEVEKRKAYKKSVLDIALADAQSLSARLGPTDQRKLDEYLTGVRELETRIATGMGSASCTPGTRPAATLPYPAHVKMMNDLMVLAMQCDVTRIFSYMQGNGLSGRTYPDLGITRGHHDISHHGMNADNLAQLTTIATWEMEQFAYLIGKMKATADGPSSNLLYNSAVFISSDISDGDRHNHDDLPVILAGNGGGALKPGRHISYTRASKTKLSNLLVTMLGTVGVNAPVGDSTGPNLDL
jgi:hypothetical protein